jgi:hypothetical protein
VLPAIPRTRSQHELSVLIVCGRFVPIWCPSGLFVGSLFCICSLFVICLLFAFLVVICCLLVFGFQVV